MEKKIKLTLMNSLPLQEIHVFNHKNHYKIIAISRIFHSMSQVEKQKLIYKPLMKYIVQNQIHSISIKAYSLEEWKNIS